MRTPITTPVLYTHIYAFLYTAFQTLTTGVFLNEYLLRAGFTEPDFGVLYALFYVTGIVAFPFSFYAESIRSKKTFYLLFQFVSLGFFLLFVSAPALFPPGSRALVHGSVITMGLFSIAAGIGRIVLIPWMYAVIGNRKWARFFMVRMILMSIVPILSTLGFAWVLRLPGLWPLGKLFLFALATAVGAIVSMMFFPDPEADGQNQGRRAGAAQRGKQTRALIVRMARTPGFPTLLVFSSLLSLGIGLFAPISYPYMIQRLGVDSFTLSLYQILMTLASIGSLYATTKICERKGNATALIRLSAALWTVPALFLLLPYAGTALLGPLFLLGVADGNGIVFAGVFLAMTNFSLQTTPQEHKTVYLAAVELAKAIFMSAGSYLGGAMAGLERLYVGSFSLTGYQLSFALSLLSMLVGLAAAVRMKRGDGRVTGTFGSISTGSISAGGADETRGGNA